MLSATYLRPIAYHAWYEHRLLLKDEQGAWFTWMGDDEDLAEIDVELATWLLQRPEIVVIEGSVMWFEPSSLPRCSEFPAG